MASEYLQIHGLFHYPASNPNRDQDNEPKRVMIGNVERGRISSQCLKRTWRTSDLFLDAFGGRLGEGNLGVRTKELGSEVYQWLLEGGVEEGRADQWTRVLIAVFGAAKPEKKNTQDHLKNETLFFCTPAEKQALKAFVDKVIKEKRVPPNIKGKEELEKEAVKLREQILMKETTAVDVALFGRMFAQDKAYSIEAAIQVAHGFTVTGLDVDQDFWTGVDDIKASEGFAGEDRGSGHLGTFAMGAGVFYVYACINRTALLATLKDEALVQKVCRVFVEAFMTVFPKGKGNSCAQQGRAFYGRVERGTKMPRNLSLAYLTPITQKNVEELSILKIQNHAAALDAVYGACHSEMKEFDAVAVKGSLMELLALAGR
jgi:CRISPR system Cascade subunit CasC